MVPIHLLPHTSHTSPTLRYPKDWTIPLGNTFAVYGWGHNHRGQLGGMEGNKIKLPRLCESFAELNPVSIVGGEQTLFAITADGKVPACVGSCSGGVVMCGPIPIQVYACGYGVYGRLGVGGMDNVTAPTHISTLSTRGIAIKKVAVNPGGKHCLAVSTTGELYTWGEGDDGKLGLGNTT